MVLGQVDVEAKTNEIPMFATPAGPRSTWPGRWSPPTRCTPSVATPSYLVTQRGAHYLITVKRNQPGLHAQLAGAALAPDPGRCITPASEATAAPSGAP